MLPKSKVTNMPMQPALLITRDASEPDGLRRRVQWKVPKVGTLVSEENALRASQRWVIL